MPTLLALLEGELSEDPKLFKDDQIDVGDAWPNRLAAELLTSRCMIAIWTPKYFRSKWCLAEWDTMRKREEILGMRTRDNPSGLVYPIVFSDGKSFPKRAIEIQYLDDFRRFAYPYPVFKESQLYIEFHDSVAKVAKEIAGMILNSPPFDSKWPTIRPQIESSRTLKFSRFQ